MGSDATFPQVAALGALPAGYAEGKAIDTETLLHLCRCRVTSSLAGDVPPEVTAWAARIEDCFVKAVRHVLWTDGPCCNLHTLPSILRGVSGSLSRAYARSWCWQRASHLRRSGMYPRAV